MIGAMLPLLLAGACASLDWAVHNPVPCSQVGPATCEDKAAVSAWDAICTPCEDAYAWDRSYDWMDTTLAAGEQIRGIDPATVQAMPLTMDDGAVLDAYLIPAHGDNPDNAAITMIFNHGNYAGIEHYLPRIQLAHEAGFTIFVWDYQGYGKSLPEGAPEPEAFLSHGRQVRDAVAALADAERVLIYANSLGALPGVEMALHSPGCALILEAGFTSVESILAAGAGVSAPDSMLTMGLFDNIEKIKGYSGPLLAMIGDEDNTFRVEDTRQLVENAATPAAQKDLWVLEGVNHGISNGGIPEAGFTAWAERIDTFLDETGACR